MQNGEKDWTWVRNLNKSVNFLLFLLSLIYSLNLVSCLSQNGAISNDNKEEYETEKSGINFPECKDRERATIDFSEMEYTRPDVEAAISEFDKATYIVTKNELDFSHALTKIKALEAIYSDINTALSFTNLKASIDTKSEYWNSEYEYISLAYPSFRQAVERLLVAAATSPDAERFEEEYFGEGLIEKYARGSELTDELVILFVAEAELISEYSALSHATVIISYGDLTDTYDNILTTLKEKYGEKSTKFKNAKSDCDELYERTLEEMTVNIFIDLLKVRRDIADALLLESYALYAYESLYHDYTPEDLLKFASEIKEYILPVYADLSSSLLPSYSFNKVCELDNIKLINGAGELLRKTDSELYDIYSYMLRHTLFDVTPASDSRFNGAFTTYLDKYSAPFLFVSTDGSSYDYSTLFHEFGHFADAYINYNSETSLDLSEVSSQALELLSITGLSSSLKSDEVELLRAHSLESALSALVFQGFYACFEHIAYSIPKDEITRASLDAAVAEAAEMMGLRSEILNSVTQVLIPHIIKYPFYVQSYCTSATVALEIYFKELDTEGDGFAVYKELLIRDEDMTFEEYILSAGLSSPFGEGYMKTIANRIYYELTGYTFFQSGQKEKSAA